MANNRISLTCVCGASVTVYKYYPSTGWYMFLDVAPSFSMDLWLREHSKCGPVNDKHIGPTHFGMEYEILPKPVT